MFELHSENGSGIVKVLYSAFLGTVLGTVLGIVLDIVLGTVLGSVLKNMNETDQALHTGIFLFASTGNSKDPLGLHKTVKRKSVGSSSPVSLVVRFRGSLQYRLAVDPMMVVSLGMKL